MASSAWGARAPIDCIVFKSPKQSLWWSTDELKY